MKKRGGIKLKFEYKLLILFSVFFLVPIMLFGFMLAANLESTYRDSAKQSNRENMAETQSGIVELRDELQGIVDEIASDEYLCSLIDKDEEDFDKAIDYINRTEFIFTRLSTAISSNEMVDSVYLYHPSGEFHYVNYSDTVDRLYFPKNEQWFSRASHLGESFFLSEHNDLQTVTKTAEICSYVAPISTGQRTADCAVMKINFSSEEFYKRIRVSEVKCTQYVLTDLDGKIAAQRGSLTQAERDDKRNEVYDRGTRDSRHRLAYSMRDERNAAHQKCDELQDDNNDVHGSDGGHNTRAFVYYRGAAFPPDKEHDGGHGGDKAR